MKTLINNATKICDNFELEQTQSESKNIDFQCTYKNLYEYLVKISKYSLVGFRLVPNIENKVFIFETYEGIDRSSSQMENERYAFSDDQANIEKASLIYSSNTEYNFALVGGPGEGSSRKLKTVKKGNPTGFDLREIFVDSKNTQDNTNIDNQLITEGENALTDETYTFDATATDVENYKVKWDLGDIVDIKKTVIRKDFFNTFLKICCNSYLKTFMLLNKFCRFIHIGIKNLNVSCININNFIIFIRQKVIQINLLKPCYFVCNFCKSKMIEFL